MEKTNKYKPEGWLDEKEFYEKLTTELANCIVVDECKKEIQNEKDKTKALSKALLGLIYAVQDEAGGTVEEYINFLLTEFEPLSKQFDNENKLQFLNQENGALLRFNNTINCKLLLRQEFFEKHFKELNDRFEARKEH